MRSALVMFNAYIWMSTPTWLEYRPRRRRLYYENAEDRGVHAAPARRVPARGRLPAAAKQAGVPVRASSYAAAKDVYELRAGNT
jgi:hypothetical protein